MAQIPTAKELAQKYVTETFPTGMLWEEDAILFAIELARLHVEAALEAASQHVGLNEGVDFDLKDEYPITNIT